MEDKLMTGLVNFYFPDAGSPSGKDSDADHTGLGRNGTSRRDFIKGVIAAGATASAGFMLQAVTGCSREAPLRGAVERRISLKVNGSTRRGDVLPHEQLAMT